MKFTSIKQQILPEKGQNVISSLSFSCSENILSRETLFTNCRQKEFWKKYRIFAFHKNLNKILEKGIMEIFFGNESQMTLANCSWNTMKIFTLWNVHLFRNRNEFGLTSSKVTHVLIEFNLTLHIFTSYATQTMNGKNTCL